MYSNSIGPECSHQNFKTRWLAAKHVTTGGPVCILHKPDGGGNSSFSPAHNSFIIINRFKGTDPVHLNKNLNDWMLHFLSPVHHCMIPGTLVPGIPYSHVEVIVLQLNI